MNILYIHQYFKTPSEPGGTRSYWIAKELISHGHSVTMLTTSSSLNKDKETKFIDGIEVIYLRIPYDQKMSIVKRLNSFLKFMFKSTVISFKAKNIDLVIATSTPLTVGFPALMLKLFKGTPYLFEVRDLWPEVPIQMGGLKNPVIKSLARWFEKKLYKNAAHIVALSPGMQSGVLAKNIAKNKVSMIPNMAKVDEFYPRARNAELLNSFSLMPNSFKIVHFGSLGMANGAHTIIESAKILKDNRDIEFVFIGGGSTEDELIKLCKDYKLSNVHFLGKFPMAITSDIVNLCDVSIVSFLDLPILYTNSPNKLFDSLSAGKPIIVNSAGWTKDLVEENECGYYVNPEDPNDLADRLVFLNGQPELVEKMGRASRTLAETKFDKSILCPDFRKIVEQLGQENV